MSKDAGVVALATMFFDALVLLACLLLNNRSISFVYLFQISIFNRHLINNAFHNSFYYHTNIDIRIVALIL